MSTRPAMTAPTAKVPAMAAAPYVLFTASALASALDPATYCLGSTAKMFVWPAESLSVKPNA